MSKRKYLQNLYVINIKGKFEYLFSKFTIYDFLHYITVLKNIHTKTEVFTNFYFKKALS